MTVGVRYGLARILSKRGVCSRTVAAQWIRAGRVRLDGRRIHDPEHPATLDACIEVESDTPDAVALPAEAALARVVVVLNKPRGLLTTRQDERGRPTVYSCLRDPALPWLAPVGRLDQASEGLLLFSNDPQWAAQLTEPRHQVLKTYHVQIDRVLGPEDIEGLQAGIVDAGERLRAHSVRTVRSGGRNSWLEIVLDEGRNRQIRRMLAAMQVAVLRLIRIGIGPLVLGTLGKGQWRRLDDDEIGALSQAAGAGEGR